MNWTFWQKKLFKPLIILILKKINNFKKWPSFRFLMVNFEPKWSKIDKKKIININVVVVRDFFIVKFFKT